MRHSRRLRLASLLFAAVCIPTTSRAASPPPASGTLEIELSGLLICLDEGALLRVVLPDFRASHHNAFFQFRRSDLDASTPAPDEACGIIDEKGEELCSFHVSQGHIFKVDPTGTALKNISSHLADVVPILDIAKTGKLLSAYDNDPANIVKDKVAAQLDVTTGTLGTTKYYKYWDFKESENSATVVTSLCTAETVLIANPVNAPSFSFEKYKFSFPADGHITIRIGNMMPDDENRIGKTKEKVDKHFKTYYTLLDYNGKQYVPVQSEQYCSGPMAAHRKGGKPAAVRKSPTGSNCPPILIKH